MTTASASSRYGWFVAIAVAVVAALAGIGFVPTRRLAGDFGILSMLAGCAIGLISAACAGLLLVIAGAETPEARMKRSFLAMVIRLAIIVALAAAAVLSGMFSTAPLLLWMGIAYMALLPLEVRLAIYG
jgi:hypothetical protein